VDDVKVCCKRPAEWAESMDWGAVPACTDQDELSLIASIES